MECTIGGTRRHLVDVARGQKAAGLDVHVLASTLRDPGFPSDLDALEAEGVGVTRLQMVREVSPKVDRAHYLQVCALLRELRPDIVHTHSSKAGVLGRQASLRTGIGKRVHTPHTFAFLFKALFSLKKRALFKAIEGHFAYRTQRIIAVSPGEAERFRKTWVVPSKRIRVVPNGIDPAPFERAEALDLSLFGVDPARPVAALVGLVYAAKGHDLAIESLARPGLEALQLLCVGPGDTAEYEALATRRGVRERVFFTGARDDVPRVMAAADLLVLPSRWEGMPYVVLEAMAASLPVVATPVDGARDLVVDKETGRLVDAITTDALAAGLTAVLDAGPEGCRAMGRAGRVHLGTRYTIDRMVEGLTEVYREIL